jgi:hypothetical protein
MTEDKAVYQATAFYAANYSNNVFTDGKHKYNKPRPNRVIESEPLVLLTRKTYDSLLATIDDLRIQLLNARRTGC